MIVAIVGPTGTGKTALALELATRVGGEIVNLDSRQVYRGLDIGSAKPTAAERGLVPHHLFDVVGPDEPFDCACYRALARRCLADVERRGRHALLVGGTGLYLRVLRYGLFDGPPRDPALRARLAAEEEAAPGALHSRLREVDGVAAVRVHPNDRARLVRALEVFELTGRPISAWQQEHGFRHTELEVGVVGLDMDRRRLYEVIERRCHEMVEGGLVDEVRALRTAGYAGSLASMRSIGYRQIGAYIDGVCTLDEALHDMARATRRLAKRQLTWFRAVRDLRWHDAETVRAADLLAEFTASRGG